MSDYRNVWTLILAVALLQVAGGLLGVITPLGLEALGVSPFLIGAIAAVYAAGFMAGAWTEPRALSLFGNIRVFSIGAALTAAAALVMELYPASLVWTLCRLVQGAGFAWMLASAESWISSAVSREHRGGVTAVYQVLAKAALMAGPFLAAGTSALSPQAYLWCGVFLALSLVPVCLTRRGQPPRPKAMPLPFTRLFAVAPSAVIGAFFAGLITTGTLALLPIFAQYIPLLHPGTSTTALAATAMAAASFGGLVGQWPVGRLSDVLDRRVVIVAVAVASAVTAGGLGLFFDDLPGLWSLALLALWGAAGFAIYSVSVAHGIDRADMGDLARMMSGLMFIWGAGSVLGPPISGAAMRAGAGPGGLFLSTAVLSVLLALTVLARRRVRPAATAETSAEKWKIAQPPSVGGAGLGAREADAPAGD